MFRKIDFVFLYRGVKGIIYHIPSCTVKVSSKKNILEIETIFNDYVENKLSKKESLKIENYLEKTISKKEVKKGLSYDTGLNTVNYLDRLEILLTNSCNLKCKYCYANEGTYNLPVNMLPSDRIKEILLSIIPNKFNSVDTVMFFGGEPLLNPKAIESTCELFDTLYKENKILKLPIYTLVSNGTLINEKIAKIIKKYNIKITISLDGPKFINDEMRITKDNKGTYDEIMNGIEILRKNGVEVVLFEVTYTSYHVKNNISKEDIVQYFKNKFGNVKILIENCMGDSDFALNNYIEDKNNDEKNYKKHMFATVLRRLKRKTIDNVGCSAGITSFMISSDFKVYPCHQYLLDEDYCIGDISSESYTMFQNQKYNDIKSKLQGVRKNIHKVCRECWAREFCETCSASELVYNNKINSIDNEICIKKRKIISEILFLICEGDLDVNLY